MIIRTPQDRDLRSVLSLLDSAFAPSTYESKLIDTLWQRGKISSHFVGTLDELVIGYVAYTWATNPAGKVLGLHLAPVAIHPAHQGQGLGTQLILETLAEYRRSLPVFVLGAPAYYARFGFQIDRALRSTFDPSGGHFQVLAPTSLEPSEVCYEVEFAEIEDPQNH